MTGIVLHVISIVLMVTCVIGLYPDLQDYVETRLVFNGTLILEEYNLR